MVSNASGSIVSMIIATTNERQQQRKRDVRPSSRCEAPSMRAESLGLGRQRRDARDNDHHH